jgi:hypothetical protein
LIPLKLPHEYRNQLGQRLFHSSGVNIVADAALEYMATNDADERMITNGEDAIAATKPFPTLSQ